ncbi:MAG TPA: dTDP-4-dehydrorhamnose reductase [Acidimicrobiales bacterium]|jgi:dTDP-4-dehydrorhamnose reductase
MRVLITGAGGQLGRDLHIHCEAQGDEVIAGTHATLDVGDRDAVYQAITGLQPDVVLHAGAYTAVDACETEADTAYRVNALGSRWVADASRRVGAYLCCVSTDYVFDGTKEDPYVEWDRPNPQSVYGRSKWGGEQEVVAHAPGASIVRTSWVCGEHGKNMVKTVLALADRPELAFVDDQRGHPSFTADLAVGIRRLAAARLPGVFHMTNQGDVSWYEFVRDILASAGHDPAKVRPIKTEELDPPRPAPRPANSVLDNAALRLAGEPLLPHYRESLDRLVARLTA